MQARAVTRLAKRTCFGRSYRQDAQYLRLYCDEAVDMLDGPADFGEGLVAAPLEAGAGNRLK